jgi:uncharacterized protein
MRFVRHIQLVLVALLLPVNVYAQVQECDRLAASPFDPQKQTTGLSFDKINPNLAIPACKKATEDNPEVARLWFQYGRALEKANRLPDAIYAYQAAAKLKSGAAYNNIGELYRDGKGFQKDLNKAAEYFTLAANLNSIEGKNNLLALGRIGVPPQASSSASQTTASAPSATANSPSFDCRKATTTVEKLICNNSELSKLDVSLAETYKEAVSKAPSIRDDQRAWNAEKNKCTDADCLKATYEDRISELTNFIVRHDRTALNQGQTSASASNQDNGRTASRSNQNNSGINSGSTQKNDDARDEAAASLGICAGALLISDPTDSYVQKVWAKIDGEVKRHNAVFKSTCGPDPKPGPAFKACLESLPRETLIFINARTAAMSEMRSSKPLSFMKNNMQGNNPTVHGIVKMAHCPSIYQTQDTKPVAPAIAQREEGYVQINPSSCLKIKGTNSELKEIAANHLKAGLNQIDFVRTELNSGTCLIVWSHPRGICKSPTYVAFQHAGTLSAVDVVKFDYQKNSITKQLSMMCF